MALTKNTLTLIFIFALLFVAQCSKASSARTPASTPGPGPASDEEASSAEEEASSPEEEASSPTEEASTSDEDTLTTTDDTSSEEDTPFSTEDTSSPTPTSEPSADSPMSSRELFEISLPDIGLQKAAVAPKTEGAKVANKQLEGIEHRIEEFKAILTKRQTNPQASESTKKCLVQCQDNFEDAIDGVKISIESINNQDLPKANVDISGIATDIETCNDCFIEAEGEDKEINGFNEWVKGVTKECLNNLKKT